MRNELTEIFEAANSGVELVQGKEIILYGAGGLGKLAFDVLHRLGIRPILFLDQYAKGNINGVPICHPNEISINVWRESLVLVCISKLPYEPIRQMLYQMGAQNIMQFYTYSFLVCPQLLSNGWLTGPLSEIDKHYIEEVLALLAHDDCSYHHYLQFLWWKTCNKEEVYVDWPILSDRKYFNSPAMPPLTDNEVLLDGGCHFGQTIEAFIQKTNNVFEHVYAFEPDPTNMEIARSQYKDNRIDFDHRALSQTNEFSAFRDDMGFASMLCMNGERTVQCVSIDSLKLRPTIIKLHLEGAEYIALNGAQNTIENYRPIVMVLADHNRDGLYRIPLFITRFSDYRLYFNLHDYCGNSAVFYFIPNERFNQLKS